jgi:hypothetical protein
MATDGLLKLLFRNYARDLLPLTGDTGATVQSAEPVELHAIERRADCVITLQRQGETYYRHIEFQSKPDPEMAERCFRYGSQLILEYGVPVLTTVLYLYPPKPRREPVFRVVLGGREINRWCFEEVFLWELDAREILQRGVPGLLALVPLMRGGADMAVVVESARRIKRAFPQEREPDAENVLLTLASGFYNSSELARVFGRDRIMQLSLYVDGKAEGKREFCVALARKYHSLVFERARPVIEACEDPARLEHWVLMAPDLSDSEFL